MKTPQELYQHDLERPEFTEDPIQAQAVQQLQRVFEQLQPSQKATTAPTRPVRASLFGRRRQARPAAASAATNRQGLYLWGGVGRGKTYLVDMFCHSFPPERVVRVHFHRFMRQVHEALNAQQQQRDPLELIAAEWASKSDLLCLDEFFVSDITDAMLLGTLLDALFRRGVVLVTTSNIPPHLLYKNGLQRARFEPAIALLQQHCQVFHLDSPTDYRLRKLQQVEIFHWPLDEAAERNLHKGFEQLSTQVEAQTKTLTINSRAIPVRKVTDGVVWFDFTALCDGPRSANDYLEVARCFHSVIISNVPVLDWSMENQARRFVNLVDVLYDCNVKLLMSLADQPPALYSGDKLQFEYQRTLSRLQEMQSQEYLGQPHLG